MTARPLHREHPLVEGMRHFLRSGRFLSVLSTTVVGTAVCSFAVQRVMGWPALIAILCTLVLLTLVSLALNYDLVEWHGLLPISLLAFVSWVGASLFWSEYQWATVAGVAYLLAFTVLGLFLALVRDTIQIARAFGDVLRFVLVLSLALEVLVGALLDAELPFLGLLGNLESGGPIQGILGSRNALGTVALIALVTFLIEYRTKSVRRTTALLSLALAGATVLLCRAPVVFAVAVLLAIAGAVLYGVRRVGPKARTPLQLAALVAAACVAVTAWVLRDAVERYLNASGEQTGRLELWDRVQALARLHPLEGWGWVGEWRTGVPPFQAFAPAAGTAPSTAESAFVDVLFQLGAIGLVLFLGLVGLAFARSWLLAGRRRSVAFSWPALVLVVLIAVSVAESYILFGFGWLTFVVCAVKASQQLSWRSALTQQSPATPIRDAT